MILYGIKSFHFQVGNLYTLGVVQEDQGKNVLLELHVELVYVEDLEGDQQEEKGIYSCHLPIGHFFYLLFLNCKKLNNQSKIITNIKF